MFTPQLDLSRVPVCKMHPQINANVTNCDSEPSSETPKVFSSFLYHTKTNTDICCLSPDVFDGHLLGSTDSQVKEKSTMKAILANLLPGNSYNPIPVPL